MKKNLLVILSDQHPKYSLGGAQSMAYEYFQQLLKSGVNTEFWYTRSTKEKKLENLSKSELYIYSHSRKGKLQSKTKEIVGGFELLKFIWLVILRKPSRFWIHQIGNNWPVIVIPILKFFKVKTIVTLHDYSILSKYKLEPISSNSNKLIDLKLTNYQKMRFYFYRYCINKSNTNVAIGELQKEILISFGVKISHLLPNGVSNCNHEISVKSKNLRKKHEVLFAGRSNLKGLDILVQSIKESKNTWLLHLAGNLDLLEYMSKVGFTEFRYHGVITRNEISELIHELDLVFACSQCFDVYPTICLEALRHGTPFITTTICGTSRLYNPNIASKLVIKPGVIPNLDEILEFTRDNYNEIMNEQNKIPVIVEVINQYRKLMT